MMMPFWEVIDWEKWLNIGKTCLNIGENWFNVVGFLFFTALELLLLSGGIWGLCHMFGWDQPAFLEWASSQLQQLGQ